MLIQGGRKQIPALSVFYCSSPAQYHTQGSSSPQEYLAVAAGKPCSARAVLLTVCQITYFVNKKHSVLGETGTLFLPFSVSCFLLVCHEAEFVTIFFLLSLFPFLSPLLGNIIFVLLLFPLWLLSQL